MLQAMKTENNIANNKIIDFPTDKVLENYLKKFIISKENKTYKTMRKYVLFLLVRKKLQKKQYNDKIMKKIMSK